MTEVSALHEKFLALGHFIYSKVPSLFAIAQNNESFKKGTFVNFLACYAITLINDNTKRERERKKKRATE